MNKTTGYTKSLYILPFDHRSSFTAKLFGWTGEISDQQKQAVSDYKRIIFQGYEKAISQLDNNEETAILVDEQFGDEILRSAQEKKYHICLPVEKSGQQEFTFEFGNDFGVHIDKYHPLFVKALIRYNPEGDQILNSRQVKKLKQLSDFAHENNYKLMIESLVPPTKRQLASVDDDVYRYGREIRPTMAEKMIAELQAGRVAVDVWKIEGFDKTAAYEKIVKQIRLGTRDNVGLIILGRGEDAAKVEQWLQAGAGVNGVIGFAIGRTVFWQPLVDYRDGKIDKEQASAKIAEKYLYFINLFKQAQQARQL